MSDLWPPPGLPGALAGLAVLATAWALIPDERERVLRPLPKPPSTLPVLGNTLDLMHFQLPRLHDWITEQCELHGGKTWRMKALGAPPLVVVSSPTLFEDVTRTQFEVFDKGPRMNTIFQDIVGGGIFAVDGEQWYQQRKLMSRIFTMRAFREAIASSVSRCTLALGEILARAADADDQPFDLGNALHRFAFDAFTEVAFGIQEKTLGIDDKSEFFEATASLARCMEARFHQPDWLWQLKRSLGVGDERILAQSVAVIDKTVYEVIDENLKKKSEGMQRQTKDIISLFVEHSDVLSNASGAGDPDEDTNPKLLRDICTSVLLAGKDTTALTMSWLVVMLNRVPEVEEKIRDELQRVLPQLFSNDSYVPTMDDVEQLVYLEAAMRESLRLNPVVPLNAKEANRDTTLCDGTVVKQGTRVYISSFALARMKSVWGPDAAEYKPERWIDKETGKLRSISAFQFPAFHSGPRICLGMRFAIIEIKIALAFLLSKFSFRTTRNPHEHSYELASSLPIKDPLLVVVKLVRG